MSVIIPDMDMPESCFDCPIEMDYGCCGITGREGDNHVERPADCPLVDIESLRRFGFILQEDTPKVIKVLERHLEEFACDHGWNTTVIMALDIAIKELKKGVKDGSSIHRSGSDGTEHQASD